MVCRGNRWTTARIVWLALIALAQILNDAEGVCPSSYYPSTHTACLDPSRYSTVPRGVSAADIDTIVSEHNRYRTLVQATDMQKMSWDQELAFVAQKLAENCTFAHDPQRNILCKYTSGQNLALGYSNWTSAMQGWQSEGAVFTYGSSSYTFSAIGHYTQMMWNNTAKVGCGYSYCTNYRSAIYVCNYSPAGNIAPRITYPYTRGTQCSACPNRCTSTGLCDCGGLVCKNGGSLDINTCTCSCPSPYRGSADCNLNCTGVVDPSYCNKSQPYGYPSSYCSMYSNVPKECPLMCSKCPGSVCLALQSVSIADLATTSSKAKATTPTVSTPKSTSPSVARTKITTLTTAPPTAATTKTTLKPTAATTRRRKIKV